VSRMKRLALELEELERGDALQELENLDAELETLDFDKHNPTISDDRDWWRQQDAELDREETDAIERQAEIQEMRTQGYM